MHVNRLACRLPWQLASQAPLDQAYLDGLNLAASALIKLGTDPARLLDLLADGITQVQRETGQRVQLQESTAEGARFQFMPNQRSDAIRSDRPNSVLLSARVCDVIISANLDKPGQYHHTNTHLARSFRKLGALIEQAPSDLADGGVRFEANSWEADIPAAST